MQPTSPPVNDHLVELLALADACRRAGASHITAIVPFFGYGRADKRHGKREPIMARWSPICCRSLVLATSSQWICTPPQIEGFFHAPVDSPNRRANSLPSYARSCARQSCRGIAGRRVRGMATHYAEQCLGASVIVLHKRRVSGSETNVTHVVGEVSGRACLIVDDMISTGGTVAESITALLAAGARPEIIVAATHGLFVLDARKKLSHPAVREVFVTDTVNQPEEDWPQLNVISIAPLIACAVRRFLANGSLGKL